ncbi:MAG: aldose 1-epimerase [Acidobacteriaceae bacterium]|nr:aldose 1-epimerase [Acidobacteriaceae bacterium]
MRLLANAAVLIAASLPLSGRNFSAEKTIESGVEVVRLADAKNSIQVTIVPSIGNRAIEMTVHGRNILYIPDGGLAALLQNPGLNGVPFLAPWANRLDATGFWAGGKRYELNAQLGNFEKDNHGLPIHGLLTASKYWEVVDVASDSKSAHVTSRLEFWKYPELMAQWPFAQRYEMTYRLADGALQVTASVTNLSTEPIPLVIGFHPYYRIPDKPRDEWTLSAPGRQQVLTDERLIPTGELKQADLPNPVPLRGRLLDTGFTDLERDAHGNAHFLIASGSERIEIVFGPKYPVAVLWEPPSTAAHPHEFICVEPMTAVTDGMNLQHDGKYNSLQTVAPGTTWSESFSIRPEGI